MNLRATQAEPPSGPRPAAMKFTYASGSRPLDGYTIKRGIGRGGFGEVYFATSDAGKELALKLIRRNLDIELRGVTQCLNIKHPNLLSLYDVKQDELGDSWVVMEFVAGDSLEAVIERHPDGLPTEEVLSWFNGIAAGVCYLHDHGIVHRDLKPGNIFSDEGIVKIGDYGLSKFISASRRSGQTESVGTVHYMAPEIGNGRYGKEIDIYALGIILYEMLTGHVPFEGESVGEVLMKHLTAEPNLEGIAEPYRSAIAKTLTKNPEARIKTVGELLTMLPRSAPHSVGNALGGRPVGNALRGVPVPPAGSRSATEGGGREGNCSARASDVIPASTVPEEPIWRAIRTSWRSFKHEWDSGAIAPAWKVAIILAAVANAFYFFLPLMAVTAMAVPLYAVYYIIRALVLDSRPAIVPRRTPASTAALPPRSPPKPAAVVAAARPLPVPVPRRQPAAREVPPAPKTTRQRIEELTGSLLAATAVAAAMSVFLSVVQAQSLEPGQVTWLLLVSTLGSWMVLIPSKLWEGREGDSTLRRLTLMLFGLALGAVAWELKDFLFVSLDAYWKVPPPVVTGERFYSKDGSPTLTAYMAYCAFLMLIVGWWKQADPARRARLRLWPVLVAVFWGWSLYPFWPFPQPWGMMVAGSMSIAVQLAASWEHGKRRVTV